MNNKDREALEKFVEEDTLSPEDTKRFAEMSDGERATFIAERFFEAGAKHGRAELQEELLLYKEAARSEAEFVNELKEEVDDLKCLINEILNEAYQDHPCESRLSLGIIKEKLEPYKFGKNPYSIQKNLNKEMDKLKEENKKLVEALKFYAKKSNWILSPLDRISLSSKCENDLGDLARQVLKEIGEE